MFEDEGNGKGRILKYPKALQGLGEDKNLTGLILVGLLSEARALES